MKYWIFSILTAAIAYLFGSLSTMLIASRFVFRTNLRRLGRGSAWLSNFRRVYGVKGFIKLALVELVKDAVPMILGGILFSSGGNAEVGRALAFFCLILGRMFPSMYGFQGGYATAAIGIGAMFVSASLGAAVLLAAALVSVLTRYLSLGTLAGAVALAAIGVLVVDSDLAVKLCFFVAVLAVVRMIPAISRIASGKEPRLNFVKDISYKFDEKI
ncbi:MAG: glycerol-3-phosphate acyltransferase [Oscillospiraceae bacterium]|nr:glycerol-3-phosphate acyltransferase [Oscillospiraceae bacterium]